MKLNIAILSEDLSDFAFRVKSNRPVLECSLKYAGLPGIGGLLDKKTAYVVDADSLSHINESRLKLSPSFVCIGKPPKKYLDSDNCNVMWTEKNTTISEVLEALNNRFDVYNDWMFKLEQAMARNEPIKALGVRSANVIGKPIWMWDCHFQTVFSCVHEGAGDLPPSYVKHADNTPWPLWEINAWKDGGLIDTEKVKENRKPYILPSTDLFEYRALAYNLFIEDEYAATVTLEEIGSEITKRDFILIERLGSVLCQALKRSEFFNISATHKLVQTLNRLLSRERVDDATLKANLDPIGWSTEGPFICAVAEPATPYYSYETIIATAEKTASMLDGVIFLMDNRDIVFVINSRMCKENPMDVASRLFDLLRQHKYQMAMGVSTLFMKLRDLADYRKQAAEAINVGRKVRERTTEGKTENKTTSTARNSSKRACKGRDCFYFEDYMLDYILDKCSTRILPETLCPPSIGALIEYDRANNTQMCVTLRSYLNNNMQISETARKLYIHRNSLIMRLNKIRTIMQEDFDDPDTRLMMLISFKLLEGRCDVLDQSIHPSNQ